MDFFHPRTALGLAFVAEAGFVAGGSRIYYRVSGIEADQVVSAIWLIDLTSGEHRQINGSFRDGRHPKPSPDGAHLAFIADVDGITQICLASPDSGEVIVATGMDRPVTGELAWSPTGRSVAFAARSGPERDPSKPYRVSRTTFRYEGIGLVEDALQDIHVLDVDSGEVRRLTFDESINEDPRWSPSGDRLIFRTSFPPDDREWAAKPSLHVLDVESGERWPVVDDWGGVLEADWCPDGDRIAFCGIPAVPGSADMYRHKRDLWTVPAAGGTPVCRTRDLTAGIGVWLEFDHPTRPIHQKANLRIAPDEDAAYVSAQRGGDVAIRRVPLSGDDSADAVVAYENRCCFLADADPANDRLLYVASTLTEPPELFLHDGVAERPLTRLNRELMSTLTRPQVVPMSVTAPDGLPLQAWALTPPGRGPFPAVLTIHTGPCNSYGNVFVIDHQLLVGAGFAVVFGNFRGSGGFGTEFMQRLDGQWGAVGEQDHHAIVDHAVEHGIADPERLGLYGMSHGGFATCWLLGRTERFKAAIAENPIVNFATSYGTMDSPWWITDTLDQRRPDQDPDLYRARSPLTYAESCTTPLLLIVGESDLRCRPVEAEQYYRLLKAIGCTTEMLRLPNSDHTGSWAGPAHVRAAQNEALIEWFQRHLIGPRPDARSDVRSSNVRSGRRGPGEPRRRGC